MLLQARLKRLASAQNDAVELTPRYAFSVFIWDEWAEDDDGVVTEGPLAGQVSGDLFDLFTQVCPSVGLRDASDCLFNNETSQPSVHGK